MIVVVVVQLMVIMELMLVRVAQRSYVHVLRVDNLMVGGVLLLELLLKVLGRAVDHGLRGVCHPC